VTAKSILEFIVSFFWIAIPAGIGCPPVHRWNNLFKLEAAGKKRKVKR